MMWGSCGDSLTLQAGSPDGRFSDDDDVVDSPRRPQSSTALAVLTVAVIAAIISYRHTK
jgi:hypothetical protein